MNKRKRSNEETPSSSSDSEKERKKLRKEIKHLKKRLKKKHRERRRNRSSSCYKDEDADRLHRGSSRASSIQHNPRDFSPGKRIGSPVDTDYESSREEVFIAAAAVGASHSAGTASESGTTSGKNSAGETVKAGGPASASATTANGSEGNAVNTQGALVAAQGSAKNSEVIAGSAEIASVTAKGSAKEPPTSSEADLVTVEKPDHEVDLDEEVLNVFGPRLEPETIKGPAIHKDLVSRWMDILKKGLNADELKKLLEAYPPPENCMVINAPKLNAEVKAAVQEATITRDNRIVEKQRRIAAGLAAIGNAVSLALKIKDPEKLKLLEHLSAAGRLLASTQREEALIRKSLILTNLNASLRDTLSSATTDEWLFGSNLEEELKMAKTLERSSKDLKPQPKPQQAKGSKNVKAPPRQSGYKNYQSTSGGNKNTKSNQTHNTKPYQKKPYEGSRTKKDHHSGRRR